MLTDEYYDHLEREELIRYFYQFDNRLTAHQYDFVHEKAKLFLRENDLVLDWGCGNGHFSHFLCHLGMETVGFSFDGFPEALRENKSFTYKQGTQSEPVRIDFPDEMFVTVFSLGVLEHVHETGGDQRASLDEIRRILRPKGRFVCFHLPNKFSWVEGLITTISRFRAIDGSAPHSRKFAKKDVEQLLASAGFRLVEYQRYNFLPRNLTKKVFPRAVHAQAFRMPFEKTDQLFSQLLPLFCNQSYFCAEKI
jgi:SAM-dependent methyltransferase